MANHAPPGLTTNTCGSLQCFGSTTAPLIVELPSLLAGNSPVLTLTTPVLVRQLTVAPNFATGFVPLSGATGMTRPLTVTWTSPLELTLPLPDLIAQGNPPPLIPRSFTAPTAAPVTGVIDSNSMSVLPSWALTPIAPAPTRLTAPTTATRSIRIRPIPTTSISPPATLTNTPRCYRSGSTARFSMSVRLRIQDAVKCDVGREPQSPGARPSPPPIVPTTLKGLGFNRPGGPPSQLCPPGSGGIP